MAGRLAPGHRMPDRPVYWMIWILNAKDSSKPGVPYHSRITTRRHGTPKEACNECYGITPTENMMFFNMTSNVTSMRRMMKQTRALWTEMGGYGG